ncbi:peptidoglycan-recognition protein 1-like [Frankliniella occidentalis]|uniref:Peptidoglycan-recognition protein 1-like n=1 Tax=Frankliniella occidentalis TaxID=133901 RepID=A0A9C6XV48_FRAOC|nr:peptidoglycan-recognition protein 1-like [Frankliniella occidentalis]
MQAKHMDVWGFEDIAFNFVLTDDGQVFEGRGWCVQGRHKGGGHLFENVSITVGLLTDWWYPWYEGDGPKKLVALGQRLGALRREVTFQTFRIPWPET